MTLLRTVACAAIVASQAAQTPLPTQPPARDSDVIRLGVDLVRVDATVTDGQGRHVPDLSAADFEVLQDGRRQVISTFDYVRGGAPASGSPPPPRPSGPGPARPLASQDVRRTIALVVDDLGLSFQSTARARSMLQRFLDTQMQAGDLVAILRTGAGMGALQQFTSDRRVLQAAVDRVRWNMNGRASLFGTSDEIDVTLEKNRTETLSAGTLGAVRYVIRGLAGLPGRKAVVLLSDGFRLKDADGGYGRILYELRTVVDASNRSGVVIYGMDMRGLVTTGPSAADKTANVSAARAVELHETQDGLDLIAAETGGLFIRNTNDLVAGLARVLDDTQGYYLLGYVPEGSTFSGAKPRFHKLEVRVTRPGLRVRSRSGFLSVPDARARSASPQNRMIAAVTSPFAGGEIRLQLSSFFGHHHKLGAFVTSVMHVDARDLTFTERADGARASEIEIVAMTFGDNGEIADQTSRRYTFSMSADGYAHALAVGLVYRMQVPLKRPGPYQLRIALRDVGSDRIGSASRFIDIPDVKRGRLTLSGLVIEGVPLAGTAAADDARDPRSTLALRMFKQGTSASYVCSVYNARRQRDGLPKLEAEVRLYRDGVEVFRTAQAGLLPVSGADHPLVGGVLSLGAAMPPGSYVIELTVSDTLAKKPTRATQTIDFDVIQ